MIVSFFIYIFKPGTGQLKPEKELDKQI